MYLSLGNLNLLRKLLETQVIINTSNSSFGSIFLFLQGLLKAITI